LLKKDNKYEWGAEQEEAFQRAKNEILSDKVLRLRDFDKKFTLYTDGSDVALGAILSQQDDLGNEYVIAYGSRVLRPEEKFYHREGMLGNHIWTDTHELLCEGKKL
jgi:RNase H-like domain found in reverse transcriptase